MTIFMHNSNLNLKRHDPGNVDESIITLNILDDDLRGSLMWNVCNSDQMGDYFQFWCV